MSERQNLERELAALDTIENLLEYAKLDILRPSFAEAVESFQSELIMHRALQHDALQTLINETAVTENSPAGGGAGNTRND